MKRSAASTQCSAASMPRSASSTKCDARFLSGRARGRLAGASGNIYADGGRKRLKRAGDARATFAASAASKTCAADGGTQSACGDIWAGHATECKGVAAPSRYPIVGGGGVDRIHANRYGMGWGPFDRIILSNVRTDAVTQSLRRNRRILIKI